MEDNTAIQSAAAVQTVPTGAGSTGIRSMGNREYKSILRATEPILQEIINQEIKHKVLSNEKEDILIDYLEFYSEEYSKKLGESRKKYFPYVNRSPTKMERPELTNKNQKGKNNREEVTTFNTIIRNFTDDLKNMRFDEDEGIPLYMTYKYDINNYLNMNYWAILMYRKLEKKQEVSVRNVIDCLFSYSRSLEELEANNPYGADFLIAFQFIYSKLIKVINKKYNISENYDIIFKNPDILVESTWDKNKSHSIQLYSEQREVIDKIMISIKRNMKLLMFYKVPPGNGKTMISVIIAAKINEFYSYLIRNKKISGTDNLKKVVQNEEDPEDTTERTTPTNEEPDTDADDDSDSEESDTDSDNGEEPPISTGVEEESDDDAIYIPELNKDVDQSKYFLYICYNNLVRTEVASLCYSTGIDLPFWMITSEQFNSKIDTLIRPWKTCYSNWRRSKKIRENKYRFGSIPVQWAYFQQMTQKRPAMIISDLYSAMKLLQTFPERFIVYFDEAFATTDNTETIRILKNLSSISVLVSATLPEPDDVPKFIHYYEEKFELPKEDFLTTVRMNRQHVSSTIVAPDGCIYYPHQAIDTIDQLNEAVDNIIDDPLKIRCYSPVSVYLLVNSIKEHLPAELTFGQRFMNIGKIRHENIRNYVIDVLRFVANSNNQELFNKIKTFRPKKMDSIDKELMMSKNAHYYQDGNTMYVSSNDEYKRNLNKILKWILTRTPKLGPIIERVIVEIKENDDLIEAIKANPIQHNLRTQGEIKKRILELETKQFKIQWNPELIINSEEHGKMHSKKIFNPSPLIQLSVKILKELPENIAKLILSGIGLYHPDTMSDLEMETFKSLRNTYKFILSTPAIIYGTNMSISNVDIDESYCADASRNSIYQLMGRAGRRGKKSYNAMIIFREWNALNRVMAPSYDDVESIRVEESF